MKKIISILMVITVLFAFSACSNNTTNEAETQNTSLQPTSDTVTESKNNENTVISGKTLVVYFSASGNTENAAKYIADVTNGDLFKLEPKNAYTDNDLN